MDKTHLCPLIMCCPAGKTRWKAVRSTDILSSKREISSLDIKRGFMAQTAPDPDQGDNLDLGQRWGGRGSSAHQALGEHKQKCRVGQAQEALSNLHWPGVASIEARGQSEKGRVGLEAKQKSAEFILHTGAPGQDSTVPTPSPPPEAGCQVLTMRMMSG